MTTHGLSDFRPHVYECTYAGVLHFLPRDSHIHEEKTSHHDLLIDAFPVVSPISKDLWST